MEPLHTADKNINQCSHCGNTGVPQKLKKKKMELPRGPTACLLGVCPQEMRSIHPGDMGLIGAVQHCPKSQTRGSRSLSTEGQKRHGGGMHTEEV